MRKGKIRISNFLIAEAFGFPRDWKIESISPSFDKFGNERSGESQMIISGSDFPETNNCGDAEIVELIVHEKARTFEVKKI